MAEGELSETESGLIPAGSAVVLIGRPSGVAPLEDAAGDAQVTDAGDFDVTISHSGPVRVEAEGLAYNEATGFVSDVPIKLSALLNLDGAPQVKATVNLVTHLADSSQILQCFSAIFG